MAQSNSKNIANIYLSSEYSNLSWNRFIDKIEKTYPIHFYYEDEDFLNFQIYFVQDSIQLEQILKDHFLQYNIFVSSDKNGNVFLNKNSKIITNLNNNFLKAHYGLETEQSKQPLGANANKEFIKTTKEVSSRTVIIGNREAGINKKTAIIQGKAINEHNGNSIEGATIIELTSGKGVITDGDGNYKMELEIGKHILTISSVNIIERKIEVDLRSSGTLDLVLENKVIVLDDVVVTAEKDNKVLGTQMGLDKVATKNVKKIPLVFGEKDIIKVAMLLPGVQSVGEGASGFNVRGSPTDQNIFYINKVPIYNTSHLSGFFSAFNADVISEFSLFKSNIPIQYGGRLSSVFEIKTKTGSNEKVTARGGIGLITGRLTVEGPLKKEKSNFLIGLRSTYSDWILGFVEDNIVKNSKAQFADMVTNFSFQLNDKNHLNVFSYSSTDNMNLHTQTKYDYQNYGGSLDWKHFFDNKATFEFSLTHSGYNYSEGNSQLEVISYTHKNQLGHTELKAVYDFILDEKHHIQMGISSILYTIDLGSYNPLSEISLVQTTDLGKEKGLENGFFIGDEWKPNPKWTFSGGLRYNLFTYFGEQDVNQYQEGFPKTDAYLSEIKHYNNWEPIKTYGGLDYRFAVNHLFNDQLSVKAAFNRLHQYIYMLNNTIAVSPNYKWKLSDYNTKPITGNQISIGLYSNLFKGVYEFSLESYYKFSRNVVEIRDGGNLFFNKNIEQVTLQGNLDAYGFEFMLKKLKGNLNGWINYTYSNSTVLVNSAFSENQINQGNSYPSNYDKPHAFNFVLNYDLTKRIALSGNMVYATGRPITYPTAIYYYGGRPTLSYSSRNAFRLPDYFRVDLSLNYEGNLLKNKIGHGVWSFSVYNALGRKNAYSVYFREENGLIQAYKLSIFGAPIFSVSYNFNLGNYNESN